MEIFNIHIIEFLLIAALALIIFGPERLPEVGRFVGKQIARFLAWQQQSPELRLINEIRSEFEREIANLRDELIRTRNQLDVSKDIEAMRSELQPMLNLNVQEVIHPKPAAPGTPDHAAHHAPAVAAGADPQGDGTTAAPSTSAAAAPAQESGSGADSAAAPSAPIPQPATQTVPATTYPHRLPGVEPTGVLQPVDERARYLAERRARLHELPDYDDLPAANGVQSESPSALTDAEREEIVRRIETLSAELEALVRLLRERGVIGADRRLLRPAEQEMVSQ